MAPRLKPETPRDHARALRRRLEAIDRTACGGRRDDRLAWPSVAATIRGGLHNLAHVEAALAIPESPALRAAAEAVVAAWVDDRPEVAAQAVRALAAVLDRRSWVDSARVDYCAAVLEDAASPVPPERVDPFSPRVDGCEEGWAL